MASDLNVVPSLRALAFNRLVKRYRKFESKGREDQLVLLLSKLPVTLIPELMRRKAAAEAIDAAEDVQEVVARFSDECRNKIITCAVDVRCQICDFEHEMDVDIDTGSVNGEQETINGEIADQQARKRTKLNAHVLAKPVRPDYGFDADSD